MVFAEKMIDEFWSEKEGKFYDSGKVAPTL